MFYYIFLFLGISLIILDVPILISILKNKETAVDIKRQYKVVGMVFLIGIASIGCAFLAKADNTNPVKEDLLNYINIELPKVVEAESITVIAWSMVSGDNYTDDYTMYETLTETIIPAYREFLNELEAITIRLQTKEVRALNEKYIEAATTQNNAFILLKSLLETQDGSRMADVNERLDKSRRLVREWQVEIQDLCKKNGVQFNPQW